MLLLRSGARLGSYELVRVLGTGGMGVVYEAHHQALGRRVALKVMHALLPDAPKAVVTRTRFLREARAAARVRHPHVVDIFDVGVHEEMPFLVMELVEGESLAERLDRERTLPLATALDIVLPIISAVGELHAAGIIHRDLKPANILLGRGRGGELVPKVADFGVSRAEDDAPGLTESGVVVGSYLYMSPEQARACKTATERADQYALGAILYHCLTGRCPFEGEISYDVMHAIFNAPLVLPSERNQSLPKALDAVIARALSRDPEARFDCVEDMGAALLAFATKDTAQRWSKDLSFDSTSIHASTISTIVASTLAPREAGQMARRSPALLFGIASVAIAVGVIAFRGLDGNGTTHSLSGTSPSPAAAASSGIIVPDAVPSAGTFAASAASSSSGAITEPLPMGEAPLPAGPPVGVKKVIPKPIAAPRPKPKVAASQVVSPSPSQDVTPLDNGAPILDPR